MKYSMLIALFVSLPTISMGSALFGSIAENGGSGQLVAVGPCSSTSTTPGAFCIDFDYTGGYNTTNGGQPWIATGTVDGNGDAAQFTVSSASGNLTAATGNNITVGDLNSKTEPTGLTVTDPNFITFATEPWTIELTEVTSGVFGAGSCFSAGGVGSAGDVCTPPTTPFNEINESCTSSTSCSVEIGFAFLGLANDGSGDMSNVSGTFSTTFSGTTLEAINADIAAGDALVTTDSGTLTLTAISGVPEPRTSLLVGAGLLVLGLVNRKRPRTKA